MDKKGFHHLTPKQRTGETTQTFGAKTFQQAMPRSHMFKEESTIGLPCVSKGERAQQKPSSRNHYIFSGCRKRSAKGVRSLFAVFGTLSVTFGSLFLTLLPLFSSFVLPNSFLPDSFCGRVIFQTALNGGIGSVGRWICKFGAPHSCPPI